MVSLRVDIQKKDLWLLSAVIVFMVGVGVVIAWGSGNPQVHGHDAREIFNISGVGEISVECVTGMYSSDSGEIDIFLSTENNMHTFSEVFNTDATLEGPGLECRLDNKWVMTGCSASTNDYDNYDNDESMLGVNKCVGNEEGPTNYIYARCCKFG